MTPDSPPDFTPALVRAKSPSVTRPVTGTRLAAQTTFGQPTHHTISQAVAYFMAWLKQEARKKQAAKPEDPAPDPANPRATTHAATETNNKRTPSDHWPT